MKFLEYAYEAEKHIRNISRVINGNEAPDPDGELGKLDDEIYRMVCEYLASISGKCSDSDEVFDTATYILFCESKELRNRKLEEYLISSKDGG